MDFNEMELSELESLISESKRKMNSYATQYHKLKGTCAVLGEEIAKRRHEITDVKVGDIIEFNKNNITIRCGVYLFSIDGSTIQITGSSKKFIRGRFINGMLYKNDPYGPHYSGSGTRISNVSSGEFRVSKKNFFDMVYKQTKLRSVIDRDSVLNDLLKD